MDEIRVTVTWMDGQQETYQAYDLDVHNGVLFIKQRMNSGQPDRHLPIANLRIWLVETVR